MEGLIWVHNNLHGSSFVNQIMKFVTLLGDGAILWVVIAIVLFFFRKTRASAIVMLISLAVGYVFNDFVLKNLFGRARPFEEYSPFVDFLNSIGLELPSGNSFPSGHSYSSFNCAIVLFLFNKKTGCFTIPTASLIALSRIFLCVHYPTDVLAGIILGIVTAIISYVVYGAICRKIKSNKRRIIRTKND